MKKTITKYQVATLIENQNLALKDKYSYTVCV